MYVFIRRDLPRPQQVVQACHAIIEATKQFPPPEQHPNVIVLGIKDEKRLASIRDELNRHGIGHIPFHEPDMDNSLTSIATEPVDGLRRNYFRKYRLLPD